LTFISAQGNFVERYRDKFAFTFYWFIDEFTEERMFNKIPYKVEKNNYYSQFYHTYYKKVQ